MKSLLATTAALEAGTGLGLLAAPSAVARLLLGTTLDAPAARGAVSAMAIYTLGAVLILGAAGIGPKRGAGVPCGRRSFCRRRWPSGASRVF